jgi:hypothetical protein
VASLKRSVVPARSAPLETLTQSVREITPPINQGAPQPARTASAPSGSGTTQTPYVPPHKVQERADPTPAEAYGTVKAEVHPKVEVKTSQTLAPVDENGEGWTEVTHKKRKGRALPPPVPSNQSAFEDEGVFWAQVASSLAIWALFVLTRHLARNRAWGTCIVKLCTALASIIWTQQLIGARAPTAVLWQQAIAAGTATPALVTSVTMCAFFARIWSHREQSLFKRARRL